MEAEQKFTPFNEYDEYKKQINNNFILPFEEVRRIIKSEHVVVILDVILVQQRVQLLQL